MRRTRAATILLLVIAQRTSAQPQLGPSMTAPGADSSISQFAFQCHPDSHIVELRVRSGYWIDAVGLVCEGPNGARSTRWTPGTGGGEHVFSLQQGERLRSIDVGVGPGGDPHVYTIQFHTDRQRLSQLFGADGPTKASVNRLVSIAPPREIVGIFGRADAFVAQLGVIGAAPTAAPPPATIAASAVTTPALVRLDGVTSVVAGAAHTCALGRTPAGEQGVWCWGANEDGRLGTGDRAPRRDPYAVAIGRMRVGSITLGTRSTCALGGVVPTETRSAFCWGYNGDGRLGDGTLVDRLTPTRLAGVMTWTRLTVGDDVGCAVRHVSPATLFCWGPGASTLMRAESQTRGPQQVSARGPAFDAIVLGRRHACAWQGTRVERFYCWGDNTAGQLGNGSMTTSYDPVVGRAPRVLRAILAGDRFNCGATVETFNDQGGTPPSGVYCWGDNSDGQLGNGGTSSSGVPVPVSNLRVTTLTVGARHACGTDIRGAAWCWGANDSGQLGDGTREKHNTPVRVAGDLRFAQLSAGANHTCGITRPPAMLYCWGANESGQLGTGY